MTDALPQGWAETTVGEIVKDISYGFTAKASRNPVGPKLLRITDIQEGTVNWDLVPFCAIPHGSVPKYKLHEGDIVFARTGATTGKSFLIRSCPDSVFASYLIRLRLSSSILPEYVARFFQSSSYWSQITDNISGSAQPNCNATKLAKIVLQIPPMAEQQRIVAKLEKLLTEVEYIQARLSRIPVVLQRFRQSALAAACSGRLTADWRKKQHDVESVARCIEKLRQASSGVRVRRGVPEDVPVSDVVGDWELPATWESYSAAELLRIGAFIDLKDGNHGSNHPKVAEFSASGLPFITAAQVNNYQIDYDGAYKLAGKPLKRINVGFAKSGDVIYTHKGSVGRVAIADRDCVLTPQTTYYRVSPAVFVNRFLMYYLASQAFSQQVNIIKEQTTRDFVPISEQYLLFHRVPPIAEQQEIVRRVDRWFALADEIESRYEQAQWRVDRLSPSILARAFQGELVPTEAELAEAEGRSSFESAEELLQRLGNLNGNRTEGKQGSQSRRTKKAVA